jgi:hypothetical protein
MISTKIFTKSIFWVAINLKKKPREKVLAEVQKKAFEYERNYYGCSQCVLLAIQEAFGLESEETFKEYKHGSKP